MQFGSQNRDDRAGIDTLLEPSSVAIIGASDDPTRIGGRPLRYLLHEGFKGVVYPVNPNRETVQGLRAYASVRDLPGVVDCALVAVPAKIVGQSLEDCAAAGVKSAIVFSSGFAETGGEGEALQAELGAIARRSGMRILGPNCLGVLNFGNRFFATFSSSGDAGYPDTGPVTIISQSGAYGTHLYAVARNWGLGVSHVITTGNECDVDVAECIGWAAGRDDVKVIAAYAEGIKNGPGLIRALEKARTNRKPVIFMKVGRSAEGAAAAASHTASLAGSDEIYDAVFRQYGAHRADTTEQMLDAVYACTAGIFPRSKRIGLVTISGGVGVQMADHAKKAGLEVAPMPLAAQKRLKAKLPFASALNPVDTTAQFFNDMGLVRENFSIMLEEGAYGTAVAFFTMAAASRFVIEPLLAELRSIREQFPDRLLILSLLGPPEVVARYREAGYLTYEDPCRAIDAAAAVVGFGASFERRVSPDSREGIAGKGGRLEIPDRALSEWESRELLAAAGVPVVEAVLVRNAKEAERACVKFGLPVAMKINAAEISHKTEIGCVALDVPGLEAMNTYETLIGRAARAVPAARTDGVIVAPMIAGGVETILGVQVDPVFGPAVMFGLGGIFVEIFKDVSFRLAPVSREEALEMIGETRGAAMLHGARGEPHADVDALADALVALSQFAARYGDSLSSVDINPFVALPKGKGAVALDCLIVGKQDTNS